MSKNLRKGSKVFWKWGRGKISGTIEEVFTSGVEKEIKGKLIKRKGSEDNPAYFIKEDKKKAYVLKLSSELVE